MDASNDSCHASQMLEHIGQLGETPLAYRTLSGRKTGIIFLGGFRSDMTGAKAQFLLEWCRAHDHPLVRFDYSGHGSSGGHFADGTISRWVSDAEEVVLRLTQGPQILVGSSMGGWIALLLALRMPDRFAGLLAIAAAPDFTEDLMWAKLPEHARADIMHSGSWAQQSAYGAPYPITRELILDGRKHLLLRNDIPLQIPVRLLHGQADPDVPWQRSLALADRLTSSNVAVTLVKDGDHRLSRPADLRLLGDALGALVGEDAP